MSNATLLRVRLSETIAEGAMCVITGILKDENDALLPAAVIDSLTLTLYEKGTKAIINARDQDNILNANGGSADNSGNLRIELYEADNAIIRPRASQELHVALIEWTYETTKTGKFEVEFMVANLVRVAS